MNAIEKLVLLLMLLAASCADLSRRKIPNWLIALGMAGGIGCRGWPFLGAVLCTVAVGYVLFYYRMIGAGDLKLSALVCGYIGIWAGCIVIGIGLLLGAAYSLFCLIRRDLMRERLSYLFAWIRRVFLTKQRIAYFVAERDGYEVTIPLAVCFLLGAVVYFLTAGRG